FHATDDSTKSVSNSPLLALDLALSRRCRPTLHSLLLILSSWSILDSRWWPVTLHSYFTAPRFNMKSVSNSPLLTVDLALSRRCRPTLHSLLLILSSWSILDSRWWPVTLHSYFTAPRFNMKSISKIPRLPHRLRQHLVHFLRYHPVCAGLGSTSPECYALTLLTTRNLCIVSPLVPRLPHRLRQHLVHFLRYHPVCAGLGSTSPECYALTLLTTRNLCIVSPLGKATSPASRTASGNTWCTSCAITPVCAGLGSTSPECYALTLLTTRNLCIVSPLGHVPRLPHRLRQHLAHFLRYHPRVRGARPSGLGSTSPECYARTLLTTRNLCIVSPLGKATSPASRTASGNTWRTSCAITPKHGSRMKCSACKIVAHQACIDILMDRVQFSCKPTFRDVGVRQYREQTVIHHHWVHRRSEKGKCKACGKKHGSRMKCSACKIVAHQACIDILMDRVQFSCKPTFRDVGVRQYREQTVIHHHWVHRRSEKGKCKACG
ncbi:Diacylglycerol kinase, partial [Operophtera brumata]